MVAIIHVNQNFRPLKWSLDKAYETIAELITVPKVDTVVIIIEFLKKVENVIPPNPDHPVE